MYTKDFSTLTDFALFCQDNEGDSKDCDLRGIPNMAHTVKLATQGWPEGAAQCAAVATRLGDVASSRITQPEPFYDVTGLDLDVAEYLSGRPECWLDARETYSPASGSVVKIVVSVGVSWAISNEQMIRRGIAIAAATSALEAAGRSVELWVALAVASKPGAKPVALARVCVKRAGQPLDLGVVSFASAHPAMLRRLGFAWLDHCTEQGVKGVASRNGYGYPADPPAEYLGDVLAPSITSGVTPDDDEILAWVAEVLASQGIETDHASKS